ncbi:hypothetical protein [Megalodesulfovibrio gigas]|uniref:hypothetical protein n=1 Tax=Megalodesulfovibrio gigas TaxID=879 RepID=UPI00041C9E03|nr:hypothetical protein [Megalodesulfovibrio gigas]
MNCTQLLLCAALLLSFFCNEAGAQTQQRKQGKADDVMMQCQREAASKQMHMDKLQQYLKQCIARKSIEAGLVEKPQ